MCADAEVAVFVFCLTPLHQALSEVARLSDRRVGDYVFFRVPPQPHEDLKTNFARVRVAEKVADVGGHGMRHFDVRRPPASIVDSELDVKADDGHPVARLLEQGDVASQNIDHLLVNMSIQVEQARGRWHVKFSVIPAVISCEQTILSPLAELHATWQGFAGALSERLQCLT